MKGIKSLGAKPMTNKPRFQPVRRGAGLGMIAKGGSSSIGGAGVASPFHEGEALGAGMNANIASRPFPKSPFASGNPAKKTRSYVGP